MISFPVATRNNRATVILDAIDAGGAAAVLEVYTGTRPGTGGAITTQTLLGTVAFSYPCGSVSNGVLTFDAFTQDDAADASGEATWARIKTSSGTFVADLDVGVTGSTAALKMNTTSVVAGAPIIITSGAIAEGNA
jgi:hypothetical protein